MRLDSPSNQSAAISDLVRRVRQLETGTPQESASIQYGLTKVVNAAGTTLAGAGHSNGRSGLLIPSGGELVTVQEYVAQQIAASGEFIAARVTDLEGRTGRVETRMATAEGSLSYAGARLNDIEGRVGRLEPRMAAAEGDVSGLQSWRSTASSQIGSLQSAVSGLQSAVTTLIQNMIAVIQRSNAHQSDLESLGKPNRPPLVQG